MNPDISEAEASGKWDIFVAFAPEDEKRAARIIGRLSDEYTVAPLDDPRVSTPESIEQSVKLVLLLMSPASLANEEVARVWQAVWFADPLSKERRLIPVRLVECEPKGFLAAIGAFDMVGMSVPRALDRLMEVLAVNLKGARPARANPPRFPGR